MEIEDRAPDRVRGVSFWDVAEIEAAITGRRCALIIRFADAQHLRMISVTRRSPDFFGSQLEPPVADPRTSDQITPSRLACEPNLPRRRTLDSYARPRGAALIPE